jgi:hypothetical protein
LSSQLLGTRAARLAAHWGGLSVEHQWLFVPEITIVEQTPRYRSNDPDVTAYDENIAGDRAALYEPRRSRRLDADTGPLFLSDYDDEDEPQPSEFMPSLREKRRISISSRILGTVLAAAAVAILFALFSSDATRDIIVDAKASIAAVFPAQPTAARPDPPQLTARDTQSKDPARLSVPANQTPDVQTVATAAQAPRQEEITATHQSALRGGAPAAATVEEPVTPVDAIHHLDPNVIASSLRRADALIASGDLAAARLVLRHAADDGNAQAAMTLAGTYDPAVLEKLGVHGFVPDVAMARGWYEKAKKFGAAEAAQRLEVLANKQ